MLINANEIDRLKERLFRDMGEGMLVSFGKLRRTIPSTGSGGHSLRLAQEDICFGKLRVTFS